MELICKVQNYSWGVLGNKSSVAQFLRNMCSNYQIDETKPYAELWMGTHVNGPSVLKGKKF